MNSGFCQTSMMELIVKIVNDLGLLTIFPKKGPSEMTCKNLYTPLISIANS